MQIMFGLKVSYGGFCCVFINICKQHNINQELTWAIKNWNILLKPFLVVFLQFLTLAIQQLNLLVYCNSALNYANHIIIINSNKESLNICLNFLHSQLKVGDLHFAGTWQGQGTERQRMSPQCSLYMGDSM